MKKRHPVLVWFRRDLRLADNAALLAACAFEAPIIPIFIWAPEREKNWQPGSGSKWWLYHSLTSLNKDLQETGSKLIIRQGDPFVVINSLLQETDAQAIFWNRCYEPVIQVKDKLLESKLQKLSLLVKTFNSTLLYEPEKILNQQGKPFQVFTFYWQACLKMDAPVSPEKAPRKLIAPKTWPNSLSKLDLLPKINWAEGINKFWQPGEKAGQKHLAKFVKSNLFTYSTRRDRPDLTGVSYLSPYLHFGELNPNQVWYMVNQAVDNLSLKDRKIAKKEVDSYLRELGWREFAYYLLHHFPHTADQPLRPTFKNFPWSKNKTALVAWQKGLTGYPIVDAGMRQLWKTGWMHNRVRMIVASFLVKDLLINWQEGARWFWDTLVDADLANNTLGWQWVAGCGADAAPYFRIFNPISQGQKFDPKGQYVREWVPELAKLPVKIIHAPWLAEKHTLDEAGVILGKTYPLPIIDHSQARRRAMAAWQSIKS